MATMVAKGQAFFFRPDFQISGLKSNFFKTVFKWLLLLALLFIFLYGSYLAYGLLGTRGITDTDYRSAEIVEPGQLQDNKEIPGEKTIEVNDREIFIYANILARRNGFNPLGNQLDGPDLKNPNLVFPGEIVILPDNRKVHVEPQGYLWSIARRHYKKDMARILILAERYKQLDEASNEEKQRLTAMMRRLAITPEMKSNLPF